MDVDAAGHGPLPYAVLEARQQRDGVAAVDRRAHRRREIVARQPLDRLGRLHIGIVGAEEDVAGGIESTIAASCGALAAEAVSQ